MLFRHHFNCKFAPALLSLVTTLCLLTAFTTAQAQSNVRLGNVQVATAPNAPPVFEIDLPRSLPAGSSIKLASPYAHAQAGFAYPLWLSDAAIQVKLRRGQAQALMIQAKRSPAQNEHELLLELSQGSGASKLVPYVFLTDPIAPSSADLPMPERPASGEPAPEARPTLAEVIERLGSQPNQGVATADSLPSTAPNAMTAASQPRQTPHKIQKPTAKKAIAIPTAPALNTAPVLPAPVQTLVSEAPQTAASAPAPTASSAAIAAAAPVAAPPLATSPSWLSRQINNPLNLALAAIALLLLAYVVVRVWQTKRAAKANGLPVLNRETGFQPTSHGAANTVFGLSDQEAVAMQQQWAQQKMNIKT